MPVRQNLHDYVADQIRNKIIDKSYASGVRLPNEYQLAEEYDVCRYTVREAIKKLTATGLVEVQRGRGTFVSRCLPSSYLKNMIEVMILEDQEIREIFVSRMAIEQKTACLAAQNATQGEIRQLEENIQGMEDALAHKKRNTYNELDLKFHETIAQIAHNKILYQILIILQDMIRYAINKSAIKIGDRQKSIEGHREIFENIRAHNGDMASMAMVKHLEKCLMVFKEPIVVSRRTKTK